MDSSHCGMTVGGVGVDVGVEVAVAVDVGGRVFVVVGEGPGVRVGRLVSVGEGVIVGVNVGGRTCVGVISASAGYNSSIAEYQSIPPVSANSVNRVPA